MTILDEIIAYKREEVAKNKELYPIKLLEESIYLNSPIVSLSKYIKRNDLNGIIAEFKRRSPSKGVINNYAEVGEVTVGYMQSGAAALSILTDNKFFGGKPEDLKKARELNFCPILRKDFFIDEYQIIEARSIGADCILLIAAVLEKEEMQRLADFARSFGLEVLVEVHNEEELKKVPLDVIDLIGVNSRDLKTFKVDLNIARNLAKKIPKDKPLVAESGIESAADISLLKNAGYSGFLIGEKFMRETRPEKACQTFSQELSDII
jgi:indole-3-glycerol phosphate synthase